MAFKMRSGNKVSFKNMGGSPAKQVGDDGLVNKGELSSDEFRKNQQKIKLLELENKAKDDSAKEAEANKPSNLRELRAKNVKDREDAGGAVLTEGVNVTDDDVNKYKSKEQLKQDSKTRKLTSRTSGGERTRDERTSDKDALLKDKLQRAKGTGRNTMTFDWKQALIGDSVQAGLKYEPAADVLQRKIDKRATKAKAKVAKTKGKKDRANIKSKADAQKQIFVDADNKYKTEQKNKKEVAKSLEKERKNEGKLKKRLTKDMNKDIKNKTKKKEQNTKLQEKIKNAGSDKKRNKLIDKFNKLNPRDGLGTVSIGK